MKKLLLPIITMLLVSCEKEEQTCICNNAKYYIPKIDERSETPIELELPYQYFSNVEVDCITGLPTWKPTPNARFIGCED